MSEPIRDGKQTGRGAAGRFARGNRASPGRPPGRGPVAEMRALLATDLDKIIGQASRIVCEIDGIFPI